MKTKITRLLLSAVLMMYCTVSVWAGLGTPPDNEIWYTSSDGSVIDPYDKNVFGATYQSNTYKDGKGVIKFDGPVTKVGDYAFQKTYLTSMSLPNSVKSIGYRAFYWMNYMKEISLGNSVETISNEAFCECDGLETIGIPASVTSLGESAFYDCNVLKFVAIGRGVTNIPKYAFYDCDELKSVATDGNGVTLGYEAFYHCDKLESVSFLGDTPPSSFGDYCFSNCSSNLKYHVLEEYYDRYNSIGALSGNVVKGPPYNEIWYTTNNGGTAGDIGGYGTPPPLNAYMGNHGVQFFDGNPPEFDRFHNCFRYCSNLVSAILPSSINSIGAYAFYGCSNLVSVSIPNSVKGSIGEHAFNSCRIQTITIPKSVNNIGASAFQDCTALRSVTILGTINSVDSWAFDRCGNLYDIFYFGEGTPTVKKEDYPSFAFCPATIYVKDATGHGNWGDRPVHSWRLGKGDGSREKPLEIENYINLYGFALEVSMMGSKDLCGKLTSDIVGNSNVLKADGSLNGTPAKEWMPIGSSDKVFCGEFNGNGHTISGLYHNHYDSGSCVGLFGKTGDGAYIHDLGLVDSYMSGGSLNGGICGDMAYGLIDNCYNAATVAWGGGIAGWCRESASITNCHNVGHIFSNGSGITDMLATNGSVENCYALDGVSNNAINNIYGTTNKVEVKSIAAFTGGEVCKLLNDGNGGTLKWFHKSSSGSNPTFSGDYVGICAEGGDYQIQTLCTVSANRLHKLNKVTVNKCNDTQYVYWYCSICGKYFKDIDKTLPESDTNRSAHILEFVDDAYIPTTTSTGKHSHWHCTHCNKDFFDGLCTIPATEEILTVPVAKNNEIWYKAKDNQKVTPYNTNAFGVTYSDAGNVYEYDLGVIRFGGNVTSIGEKAFYRCGGLTSITIPSSVTSIGEEVFSSCGSLQSINIPSGVTSIGAEAFSDCRALQSVTFKSLPQLSKDKSSTGLSDDYYKPFYTCSNLTSKILDLTDSDKPYIGTSLANYPDGFTEACYRRTLEKDKWGTILLPFAPTAKSMAGLEFYELKEMTTTAGGSLAFTQVEAPVAGVPYLVKNVSDSKTEFTFIAATPINIVLNTSNRSANGFTMKGTFQSQNLINTDGKKFYCLDGDKFKVISGEQGIDPLRVYIETENMSADENLEIIICLKNGDGTAANPYQISNREELEMYAQIINSENSGACGILTADIMVNTDIFDNDGKLNGGKSFGAWTPIGTAESPFTGTLDGNGYTISGLYQKETSANAVVGFMGYVGTGGNVKDIIIRDSYLFAGSNMGKLCYNNNGGTLNGYITMGTLNGGSIAVGNTQTAVTDTQFGSGEVCWLLNGSSSENVTWTQTLGQSGNKYPTIAAEGIVYLTARKCDGSVKAFSNTKPESVVQDKHTCTKVERVESTCTERGNIQHWDCDACGKNFADEDGITELTDEQILLAFDPDNHSLSLIDSKAHCEWCKHYWEHYLAQDDKPVLMNSENDRYSIDKVDLKYGHSYLCTDDVEVNNFSYTFRYYPNVWNSLFVPFEITTDELGSMKFTAAYIAGVRQYEKDASGNIITQVDVVKIKNGYLFAGTPYLIKQESSSTQPLAGTFNKMGATLKKSSDVHPGHTETMTAKYDFIGTYNTISKENVKSNYYILGSEGAFAHPSSPVYAMNWYMKIEEKGAAYGQYSSQAKAFIINVIGEEDQTTGIRTLYPAEKQVREVYDLSGRRLDAPRKGQVNIINGKKIFVK